MSPALNGNSALLRFERSNTVEIRNGIMFDFYPGLPHIPNSIDLMHLFTYEMEVGGHLDTSCHFEGQERPHSMEHFSIT